MKTSSNILLLLVLLILAVSCSGGTSGEAGSLDQSLPQTSTISGLADINDLTASQKPRAVASGLSITEYTLETTEGTVVSTYSSSSMFYKFESVQSNRNYVVKAHLSNGSQIKAITDKITAGVNYNQEVTVTTTMVYTYLKKRTSTLQISSSDLQGAIAINSDKTEQLVSAFYSVVKTSVVNNTSLEAEALLSESALLSVNPNLDLTSLANFVSSSATDNGGNSTNDNTNTGEDQTNTEGSEYLYIDISTGISSNTFSIVTLDIAPDLSGAGNELYKKDRILFRKINQGTFMMGSEEGDIGRRENEYQKEVTLTESFYMAVFELTVGQYQNIINYPEAFTSDENLLMKPAFVSYLEVIGGDTSKFKDSNPYAITPNPLDPLHVVDVRTTYSYPVEDSICGVLSQKTGKAFDLPTEAQWEYSCRSGTTTSLNNGLNLISKGQNDAVDEVARYFYNSGANTNDSYISDASPFVAVVGSYKPNNWGLYDMHGNGVEWCSDWYTANINGLKNVDPEGASSGDGVILRGGSWNSGMDYEKIVLNGDPAGQEQYIYGTGTLRSSYRNRTTPINPNDASARLSYHKYGAVARLVLKL